MIILIILGACVELFWFWEKITKSCSFKAINFEAGTFSVIQPFGRHAGSGWLVWGHFCKDFVWGGCGTNIQLLIDWQEQLFKTVANFLNPCWLHAKGSCEEATTIIRGVWSVSSVMLLLAAFVGLLLESSSLSSEVFPPQCSFSSCWQASLLVSWIIATAATFSHLATLLSCRRCWLIIGDKKGFKR